MPSKLRKAIGAVKDQTSISLAKVSNNASNLDVAILKATTHEEISTEERYTDEVLALISSNKVYAAACAQALSRRIGKTRNWIVALKSLMLVLRIFQDGDPYFPREVLHTMKRGSKLLNLSNFRDDSNSSPWDYTAFVRTFALYLDERLDCFLTGKLQKRFAFRDRDSSSHRRSQKTNHPVRDMKPTMLLDRISYWQKLLERAIATRPTGAAKTNRLVQICLYAIVQESFDLYRDISDGLALLLDSFFHLQYQSCVNAFQTCVRASKQFEELSSFYDLCKIIGVGRSSEYPSVQKISSELMETLQEFLKDQASFPSNGRSPTHLLLLPAPPSKDPGSSSGRYTASETSIDRFSERDSECGSQRTSLEDLMTGNDQFGTSPSVYSIDQESYTSEQYDNQSQQEDFFSVNDADSIQATSSSLSLVCLDDWPQEAHNINMEQEQEQSISKSHSNKGSGECWELVLAEATNQPTQANSTLNFLDDLYGNNQNSLQPHHPSNPFLEDTTEIPAAPNTYSEQQQAVFSRMEDIFSFTAATTITSTSQEQATFLRNDNIFSTAPTFQATPTFCTQNPEDSMALTLYNVNDDPFGSSFSAAATTTTAVNDHAFNGLHAQNPDDSMALTLYNPNDDPFGSSFGTTTTTNNEQLFNGPVSTQNLVPFEENVNAGRHRWSTNRLASRN